MSLVITNNVASLVGQDNLSRTEGNLTTTLQRLSSGLKINSGADGPAALVISQEQQSQMAGLQQAIANTTQATSMVQTTEGALGEINSLLVQIRSLALDSANNGANDANALAANQAQVSNALATIDRIASNTQFGTKNVLDGSAGFTGTVDNANVTFLKATSDSPVGTFAVSISQAAAHAVVDASTGQTGNLAQNETLTINGVAINLTAGQDQTHVIATINQFTSQTGVTASTNTNSSTSAAGYTDANGTAAATDKLSALTQNNGTAYATGDKIDISGKDGDGSTIASTPVTLSKGANETLQDVVNDINAAGVFKHATVGFDASTGKITVTANANDPLATARPTLAIADDPGNTGGAVTTWQAVSTAQTLTRLTSGQYGSNTALTVETNVAAGATSSGFTNVTAHGQDVAGTIGGHAAIGNGNVLTGQTGGGADGISLQFGQSGTNPTVSVSGALGTVTVDNKSLVFQIGANANQTASVAVDNVHTAALGLGVIGVQFANLTEIDVRSSSGAQDAIKVIDQASGNISNLRGALGAFQDDILQSSSNNLHTMLENTTSAESAITDTDYAAETANLARYQVMAQAGTAVLSSANQSAQLVLALLQGH